MSKEYSIVKYLLEQRYQQNILNEATDDGGDGGFSYNKLRKAKGPRPEDLLNMYADAAYDIVPGVKGMAQAEVPFAKKDPVAYDKARSIFAKALVDARKEAFDDRQKLIAAGISDPIKVDETEILKKALAKKPELAQILTRDEYESLAGDITKPLELNISGKDEKTGNEYSKAPVTMDKWGGIDDTHAALYGFLRGAQESLTTPEGLAMAAAGGAAFKGLGMGAGAIGRAVGPKIATSFPNAVKYLSKVLPAGVGGRAKDAAELGSAVAQSAVNVAGLGALGYGAYQANEAGQLPGYLGQIAGGVAPFAVGSKAAGVGIPAGIKAAPVVYAKGKQVAGDVGAVAKGTAESAVQAGKNVAGAVSAAGRAIVDTPWSDIPGNLKTGIKELIPDPRYKIIRGKAGSPRLERSYDPMTGEYSAVEAPSMAPTKVSSLAPSKPVSGAKQRAAVTAMAALAARNGVPSTNVDISKPSSSISSVETAPRENLGNVEMRPPTVPESKPVSAVDTTSSSSNKKVTSGSQSTYVPVTTSVKSTIGAKPINVTADNTKQTAKKYSNDWWKVLQGTKVPAKEPVSTTQNQVQNQIQTTNFNVNNSSGGGLLPPMNIITAPPPPPPTPPPVIPPVLPAMGGIGSGGGRGSYDDDDQLRMKGGDISAMLQNLYQTARTIRIR
jgi:hypothetical protein